MLVGKLLSSLWGSSISEPKTQMTVCQTKLIRLTYLRKAYI